MTAEDYDELLRLQQADPAEEHALAWPALYYEYHGEPA